MAAGVDLRLSPLLCFLFSKLNKYDVKFIKQSIMDYYTSDDVHEAKEVFLTCVSTLKSVESLSKIRGRRGDDRAEHELNDIFLIISELDEKQTLCQLPLFVSDSAEKMPSISIVEGDLRAIMNRFGKMEQHILHLQSTLNRLASDKAAIAAGKSVINMQRDLHSVSRTGGGMSANVDSPRESDTCDNQRSTACQAMGLDKGIARVIKPSVINRTRLLSADQQQPPSNKGWADAPFSSASASCDDHLYLEDTWQTSSSRKRRRTKTKTQGDSPLNNLIAKNSQCLTGLNATDAKNYQSVAVDKNNPSTKMSYSTTLITGKQKQPTMLVGKKNSDSTRDRVIAAKPFIGKAVFCIDNVSVNADVPDIVDLIKTIGVNVLSCFQVKPRRSQWQRSQGIVPEDRKAFRICIPREETSKLLDVEAWPAHIAITAWRFIKPVPENQRRVKTPIVAERRKETVRLQPTFSPPPVATGPIRSSSANRSENRDCHPAAPVNSFRQDEILAAVASGLASIRNSLPLDDVVNSELKSNDMIETNEIDLSCISVDMDNTIITNFE
jgi:hypothetical protein